MNYELKTVIFHSFVRLENDDFVRKNYVKLPRSNGVTDILLRNEVDRPTTKQHVQRGGSPCGKIFDPQLVHPGESCPWENNWVIFWVLTFLT